MAVVRLTQRVVDGLRDGPAPERDTFLWSEREAGFGLKRRAGSRRTAWIYQWRDPTSGRSHRIALGDAAKLTVDAARAAMRAKAAQIATGINPLAERQKHRSSPSFQAYVETYQRSTAWRDKAPSTRLNDGYRLRMVCAAIGSVKLSEITLDMLRRLHRDLCDPATAEALARKAGSTKRCRRGGEGAGRRSMRLVRAILSHAVEAGEIAANPGTGLKLGSDGQREHAPDHEQYRKLWAAVAKARGTSTAMDTALDAITLLGLTGSRRSEIGRLRWEHVDLAAGRIVLPPDQHKSGRKTGRSRVIELAPEAAAILRNRRPQNAMGFVFEGVRGVPVDLAGPWHKVRQSAGLGRETVLHSLRHGLGSALAEAGHSAHEISLALGHSGWAMSQRYVHGRDQHRARLAVAAAALVRPHGLYAVS